MSLRKAAEMALPALEYVAYGERPPAPEVREAIATLRHALAEADEPPRREPLTDEAIAFAHGNGAHLV